MRLSRRWLLIVCLLLSCSLWAMGKMIRQHYLNSDFGHAIDDAKVQEVKHLLDLGADATMTQCDSTLSGWERLKSFAPWKQPKPSYSPVLVSSFRGTVFDGCYCCRVEAEDIEIAALLLRAGADPNSPNTALMMAQTQHWCCEGQSGSRIFSFSLFLA